MTQNLSDKEVLKAKLKARAEDMPARETKLNEGRSGIGTRIMLALTRGKNPQEVQYEGFDEDQPKTLPTKLTEFMEIAAKAIGSEVTEPVLLPWVIDGFNSWSYTQASDPIAEYVESSWDKDLQSRFRLAVRNYATGANVSIEDAVSLMKPAFVAVASQPKSSPESK